MRSNETVFQYLVAIRELTNRGQGFLDEASIMEYCINGIPDSRSNKLILYGCTTSLTGYFRKFIPAYSVIAKPLSDLLRKDTPFNFDVKQKASFVELKRLLCQKTVLDIYRQNCETEIHNDASIDGLASVLLQRSSDDNSLHPIYYMSRKTSETERKYTNYQLEVVAI
ncbi:transposon Ty3-G Gag-Pol polyprotein [Trichonephila clavipes]|nr:transposon Ty3-G Gag-Pol polyprotein [Trichonephila clavipes]